MMMMLMHGRCKFKVFLWATMFIKTIYGVQPQKRFNYFKNFVYKINMMPGIFLFKYENVFFCWLEGGQKETKKEKEETNIKNGRYCIAKISGIFRFRAKI